MQETKRDILYTYIYYFYQFYMSFLAPKNVFVKRRLTDSVFVQKRSMFKSRGNLLYFVALRKKNALRL